MRPPGVGTLLSCVGNTPLIELTHIEVPPGIRIYAKLEGHNPTGSIKDRIALAMVEDLEERGQIQPGDTLVEASTGNTAIALAMVTRQKGYDLRVVIPREVAPSIRDILQVFGVEVIGCESCDSMTDAIDLAEDLAHTRGWTPVRQFSNPINLEAHYQGTGLEIDKAMDRVDAVVAGIGTGGTLMGVGRRLRERSPDVQVIGVEARLGDKLQGLRSLDEGFRPPLLDLDALDGRFLVDSATAMKQARMVVQKEGVMAGISAGATLHAGLRVAEKMRGGKIVVIFADGTWKYIPARPWGAADQGETSLDDTHWW